MKVSEVITEEHINEWKPNDIITISAGTGKGKSYFIKNILYTYAKQENKKILMLIHRTNCKDQFQEEIETDYKTDTIEIKTYQSLEAGIIKNQHFDFSQYKYVICDEFHYFMSDASFNKYTDISFDEIISLKTQVKIYMSATAFYMKTYINTIKNYKTLDYMLPVDFNFIKELMFFNEDKTMENFIDDSVKRQEKTILFIQSAKKAYELYSKYKDVSLFNCSKFNKEYYKYVDDKLINTMLKEEKFNKLILITTTTMDAGVNIKDEKLKHIVCDVIDIGTLVQCIGRKRLIYEEEKICVYIKTINNNQLGGMKIINTDRIKKAEFLRNNNVRDYIMKYGKENDYHNIVYDQVIEGSKTEGTKKVNELMYYKSVTDNMNYNDMIIMGKYGYCKYLAHLFGFYDKELDSFTYQVFEEAKKIDQLERYLNEIVGNDMLQVKDRKELIEMINVRDGRNNRLVKSIATLNDKLKEVGSSFIIEQFRIIKTIDGKKRDYKNAWRILRLADQ